MGAMASVRVVIEFHTLDGETLSKERFLATVPREGDFVLYDEGWEAFRVARVVWWDTSETPSVVAEQVPNLRFSQKL